MSWPIKRKRLAVWNCGAGSSLGTQEPPPGTLPCAPDTSELVELNPKPPKADILLRGASITPGPHEY